MNKLTIISIITAASLFGADVKFSDANNNYARVNPSADANTVLSYHSSIEKAKKSVVNISTSKTIKVKNNLNSLMDDPFFKEFLDLTSKLQKKEVKKQRL